MSDSKRKVYLNKSTLDEAQKIWQKIIKTKGRNTETIYTKEAEGRINVRKVRANRSAPHFYASAMDGFAIKSERTKNINERNPGELKLSEDAVEVNTGSPIPDKFNAVIKVEEVQMVDDNTIRIYKSVPPWHNIRSVGESVLKGEQILCAGEKITSHHVGALLEAGVMEIEVYSRPKLSIIPTGNEIVPPEKEPQRGELVDFNSTMIACESKKLGAKVETYDICPDDPDILQENIIQAVTSSEIVAVIAGSSAGTRDHTANIIEESGEIFVHGVDIMPGKPLLLGEISSTPVIGLPGYPLSCLLDYDLFLKKALKYMQGNSFTKSSYDKARLKSKVSSSPGRIEFLRVNLRLEDNGEFIAAPRRRGSATMKSLLQADGYLKIPANREGLDAEETGEILPLKSEAEISRGLVLIGSNDPALEELRDLLYSENKINLRLQSRGSQAGIHSLLKSEADIAAAHLLDEKSGEYNRPYLQELAETDYNLLTLAWRQQGLIVRKDSPAENLQSLEDLANSRYIFINRQRGAGTRILLDYELSQQGISARDIEGYNREEYTHAAVAQAVASGGADVTLGIKAAAEAFDLGFIPLFTERFELIYPTRRESDHRIQSLVSTVNSAVFQERLKDLGGYFLEDTGGKRSVRSDKRGDDNGA